MAKNKDAAKAAGATAAAPSGAQNPTGKASAKESAASRREALRVEQLREQQRARRNKQLKVGALVLVLALLLGLGGWGLWRWSNKPKSTNTPQHAAAGNTGIAIAADKAKSGVRKVVVYQDFQCPGCKAFDTSYGQTLNDMAQRGEIALELRTLTFLDSNLPMSDHASQRAAVAATCADATTDNYWQYFQTVYAHQPEKEGQGYTDEQLRSDFAQEAGISGDKLTAFQQCYADKGTQDFVNTVDSNAEKELAALYPKGQFSTPSVTVDGKLMDLRKLTETTPEALKAAIDATK